jgi:hypothetical protein
MAYIANLQDDEDKKAAAQGAAAPSTSGVIDSTVAAGGPTGAAQPQQAAQPAPGMAGSGFHNLDQYLSANKGAGARMANDATAGLRNDVNSFGSSAADLVKQSQSRFNSAAGAANAARLQNGLKQNPAAAAHDANAFLNAGYRGPSAAGLTSGLQADKASLTDRLGKVADPSNQTAALAGTYGAKQPYTAGFGTLDQFLVQGQKGGRDALANVAGKTANVNRAYDTAANQLGSYESKARAGLDASKAAIRGTAADVLNAKANWGANTMNTMNAALDPEHFDGTVRATLGDAIGRKERLTMDALSELAGTGHGAWNRVAGYNKGVAREPTPEEAAAAAASGSGVNPARENPNNPIGEQPTSTGIGPDTQIPIYVPDPGNLVPDEIPEKVPDWMTPGGKVKKPW